MRIITLTDETKQNLLENLLKRSTNDYGDYEKIVADIIENVKKRKEDAIFEYSLKFDNVTIRINSPPYVSLVNILYRFSFRDCSSSLILWASIFILT